MSTPSCLVYKLLSPRKVCKVLQNNKILIFFYNKKQITSTIKKKVILPIGFKPKIYRSNLQRVWFADAHFTECWEMVHRKREFVKFVRT